MKYICSCSGGKDSIATVILAHEHNEPLDLIVFAEVMFDENISGELPEHIDFIKNKAFPLFENWGYETKIIQSPITYMQWFNKETVSGQYAGTGKIRGFTMANHCGVNRDLKSRPIKRFFKSLGEHTSYVGIAADEEKRLSRITQGEFENQISLLAKYGYTEEMARKLCERYGLLSPIYQYTKRGGVSFALMRKRQSYDICGQITRNCGIGF